MADRQTDALIPPDRFGKDVVHSRLHKRHKLNDGLEIDADRERHHAQRRHHFRLATQRLQFYGSVKKRRGGAADGAPLLLPFTLRRRDVRGSADDRRRRRSAGVGNAWSAPKERLAL